MSFETNAIASRAGVVLVVAVASAVVVLGFVAGAVGEPEVRHR